MKRLLIAIVACSFMMLQFCIGASVQAQPLLADAPAGMEQVTKATADLVKQLEEQFLPQLETILSADQIAQFKTSIAEGGNLRKAFKSMALTMEQKTQLGSLLKSLPKKDIFATMTSEQKKELFMKKKEMFRPSMEEITSKIPADKREFIMNQRPTTSNAAK